MSNDKRPSRRQFLVGLGVTSAGLVATGAGAVPALSGLAAAAAEPRFGPGPGTPGDAQLFGRIFASLPPFSAANDTARAALLEVGQPGGIMDALDDLAAGPKALIVDPTVNGNPTATDPYGANPDNPTMTAGSTFVGQFTDHDITFDQTSQLGIPQNPLVSPNTRTPALDLDSVFGGGRPATGSVCPQPRRHGRAEAAAWQRRGARGRTSRRRRRRHLHRRVGRSP